ncbi:lipid A biosynthesis lauroyl acyltransferase [Zavarzinia compransoris]|uniref:Lipid A biosynthesis lauroyl acyltransferase n=1 Tax=Zavarzinia compransoris TaxID=1264899 RepID=A0A317E4K6_9PROT|nr:lipid A biosynthesis lauroyl acyltransferase [Zavarzinia compransoris]PWR22058.1 lipid A biosynthesis lauroyl acyltransferase [Zavarzinia compransoris]TDP47200.1 KDO2-lipid IV(A) lauroyltransferase [Zavarzinia compransoris]
MRSWWLKTKLRLYRALLRVQWGIEAAAIFLVLGLCKLLGPDRASALGGFVASRLGPRIGVSRTARRQLETVFPGLGEAERERIVRGVWDNLGRYFTEYAHLRTLWPQDFDVDLTRPGARVEVAPEVVERFLKIRDDGLPAIIFTGHLGNWEVLGAGAAHYDLRMAAMFRAPNNPIAEKVLLNIRGAAMGKLIPTGFQAALLAARELEAGGHLGMLVDQHFSRGVAIPFLGREARTSTTLAKLARKFKCPVYGAWAERLDGCRFRIHMTEEFDFAEEYEMADAKAAETAIMARVTAEIETWVRARPDQWNWLHRRWR